METRVIKHGASGTSPATRPETRRGARGRDIARPGRAYFVGRRPVLEQLYNSMADAATSGGLRLAVVTGADGLGKTRLFEELVSILASGGRQLKVYRLPLADPSGAPLLTAILRKRFGVKTSPDANPRDDLDSIQVQLSTIVPPKRLNDATRLLGSLTGLAVDQSGAPLPGFDLEVLRSERFRARAEKTAINLLRYDAGRYPHVLVLDDWDRAARPQDLTTALKLLSTLAASGALALVGSRTRLEPPIALPSPGVTVQIGLAPLDDGDMTHLVRGLLEEVKGLPDHVVSTTVAQAQGSPAMGQELVRLLLHRGAVRREPIAGGKASEWVFREDSFEPRTIPGALADSVRERLTGFAENERAILEAAAVFGPTFWIGGVVSLLRAAPDAGEQGVHLGQDPVRMRLEGTLMSMIDRDVFEIEPEDPILDRASPVMFASEALRNHAYEALERPARERLHRLAAQWLAAAKPVDRLAWLSAQAQHLETGGLGREAARMYLEAGDLAHSQNSPLRRVELYRRGLSLVGDDSAAVAADLLNRLASAYMDLSDYDEAERCLRDELLFASILDDDIRRAHGHTTLGSVLRARGQYDRAHEHIDFGLSLFREAGDQAGIADAREKLSTLLVQRGDKDAYGQAQKYLQEALKLRRALRDARLTARTLSLLANVKYSSGSIEDAIRLHQEALAIRERLDDKRGQLLTLNGLGVARYDNGQPSEAMKKWERAIRLAEELGDRTQHTIIHMNLSEARLESGDIEAAEPGLLQAIETARELNLNRLLGLALALQSALELARGREEEALARAEEALEVGYGIDSKQVLGHALLTKARALSHTLFVDVSGPDEARGRAAAECFQKAITLLEEMGERPTLVRALDAYGTFLLERGVKNKGRKAVERAEKLRQEMRSPEQAEKAFHEARTIRRQYPTNPIAAVDLGLVLDSTRGKGKKKKEP